jgi:HlyD family secretion protein
MKASRRVFRRLKSLLILVAVVAAIAGGGWYYFESAKELPIEFLTASANRGDMRSVILATGKVQPVSLVSVGTQISGTLRELYVDYNSKVEKGQLIALIDPQSQEADLAQASASLEAIEADVAEARANLLHAEQNLARSRELYARDLISRASLDTDETNLATARARLASARARVDQQRASIRKSKLELGYTRIYSPVDGVVVTRNVNVGQTVAASFNTPTIAEIAEDLSRMQVEVNIDEADIGNVRENQRVEFNVDAFPDRGFVGAVTQIRLSPTSENNVISYKAIVSFLNEQIPGQNLIPGMTANVTLIVEEKKDVMMVPNAALRFRPLAAQQAGGAEMDRQMRGENRIVSDDVRRGPTVYRLENGEPSRVNVESGITDGVNTEIISGIDEGTEVIVGIDAPRDV